MKSEMRREVKTGLITRNGVGFCGMFFRFSFPALTERKGDRALWFARLGHAAKGHTQTPALWSKNREKTFLEKEKCGRKIFFFKSFFFLSAGKFPSGPWMGRPPGSPRPPRASVPFRRRGSPGHRPLRTQGCRSSRRGGSHCPGAREALRPAVL